MKSTPQKIHNQQSISTEPIGLLTTMTENREHFHTINGTEIQLFVVDNKANVEIQCDSITYHHEQKRRIKRIGLLLLCGILFNYAIFNSSAMLPINIFYATWLLFEIHRLTDLIQFGTFLFIFILCFVSGTTEIVVSKLLMLYFPPIICLCLFFYSFDI